MRKSASRDLSISRERLELFKLHQLGDQVFPFFFLATSFLHVKEKLYLHRVLNKIYSFPFLKARQNEFITYESLNLMKTIPFFNLLLIYVLSLIFYKSYILTRFICWHYLFFCKTLNQIMRTCIDTKVSSFWSLYQSHHIGHREH